MTNNDILTLAKAGFTATQIAALSAVNNTQTPPPAAPAAPPATGAPDLNQMLAAMQLGNLLQANQPPQETTDDILASIINPPMPPTPNGGK